MPTVKQLSSHVTRAAELLRRPERDPRVQALAETLWERTQVKGDTARAQLAVSVARQVADHARLDDEEDEVPLEQAASDIAAEIRAMPDTFLDQIEAALTDRRRQGLRVLR